MGFPQTSAASLECPYCGARLEIVAKLRSEPQPGRARTRSAQGRFGLSEREAEAVNLRVQGLRVRAVARKMGVAEQVVKTYLLRASKKMGCTNAIEMTRLVLLGRGDNGWRA